MLQHLSCKLKYNYINQNGNKKVVVIHFFIEKKYKYKIINIKNIGDCIINNIITTNKYQLVIYMMLNLE